jgi:hypothetical protein
MWSRFALLTCSLAEFPGVPPAKKESPEMTHEISVFAINPDFADEDWRRGAIAPLEPVNHVVQFRVGNDAQANRVAARAAESLVTGSALVEPQGVEGAREWFAALVRRFAAESRE